jgi:RNA polymerase primary sigma factor
MKDTRKFIDNSDEILKYYFKDVRRHKRISNDDEIGLFKKIKKGDTNALNKIIESNLRFVITIAKEYQNNGLSLPDLISEGNLGLLKAIERYEPEKGVKFISYAVWWIKQAILQSINENSRIIRLPVNISTLISKTRKQIEKFENNNHRDVTDNDMDLSVLKNSRVVSMNDVINEDGDELVSLLIDVNSETPDKIYEPTNIELKKELFSILYDLPYIERQIIILYYGFNDEKPLNLEDIGEIFGITKERVRQIKDKTLKKLKNESHNLFKYL